MVDDAAYAGDVTCSQCWQILQAEPQAQLVDVRSSAEWAFVGVPQTAATGRDAIFVEWQSFPTMAPNPMFTEQLVSELDSRDVPADAPVLFLCRSGARSRAAAQVLTAAGYARAYNVAGGFEGDVNESGHRGQINGWKYDGLPWSQK